MGDEDVDYDYDRGTRYNIMDNALRGRLERQAQISSTSMWQLQPV